MPLCRMQLPFSLSKFPLDCLPLDKWRLRYRALLSRICYIFKTNNLFIFIHLSSQIIYSISFLYMRTSGLDSSRAVCASQFVRPSTICEAFRKRNLPPSQPEARPHTRLPSPALASVLVRKVASLGSPIPSPHRPTPPSSTSALFRRRRRSRRRREGRGEKVGKGGDVDRAVGRQARQGSAGKAGGGVCKARRSGAAAAAMAAAAALQEAAVGRARTRRRGILT